VAQDSAREDVPSCKKYWHLILADRRTRTPVCLNLKGAEFEHGLVELARRLNTTVNFDIGFTISTNREDGVVRLKNFKAVTEEDRAAFSGIRLR
jgi:hypothetical protein